MQFPRNSVLKLYHSTMHTTVYLTLLHHLRWTFLLPSLLGIDLLWYLLKMTSYFYQTPNGSNLIEAKLTICLSWGEKAIKTCMQYQMTVQTIGQYLMSNLTKWGAGTKASFCPSAPSLAILHLP